jgi:hypothetical protein
MTTMQFVGVVALGAAALAIWLDVRFDARTPRTLNWTFLHTAGAMLGLFVMAPLITLIVHGSDSPVRKIAAVLTVLLPALTYTCLAAIWLLKLVQRHAHMRS